MKLYPDCVKRWNMAAVAAALVICAGCSDDIGLSVDNFDQMTSPSDCLAFTTRLAPESRSSASSRSLPNLDIAEEQWVWQTEGEREGASRGTLTNYLSGEAGVFGVKYDDTENSYIEVEGDKNLKFTFDGDKLVSTDATIFWNTIDKPQLDVYAYAPYIPTTPATPTDGMRLDFTAGLPKIDYIVPDEIADQKDLLVASRKNAESYKNTTIPITFNHALTAIRFRVAFTKPVKVKSVEIQNVYNHGEFDFANSKWTISAPSASSESTASSEALEFSESTASSESEKSTSPTHSYSLSFGEQGSEFKNGILNGNDPMILLPQVLPPDATLVLTCREVGEEVDKTYSQVIGGMEWKPGKLITYTFHHGQAPETIYFDLAAGDVIITADAQGKGTYSGAVFKYGEDGQKVVETISGEYKKFDESGELIPYHFYVYQSTDENWQTIWADGVCKPPTYDRIRYNGRLWSEYITNNANVDEVIDAWCAGSSDTGNDNVAKVGRKPTDYRIDITGNVTCDLTIDNIYSTYQDPQITSRRKGGISFEPEFPTLKVRENVENAKVTIKSIGDNRVGAVHYCNTKDNGNEIIFEGTGSLTVADVNGKKGGDANSGLENDEKGYWYNHWCSAIGGCDDSTHEICYGIVINSGILFAGTTKAENCTAIGGGGNSYGAVTINGGTVTAVATTTGTAIGGGIGYHSEGGVGKVEITGGNVYAYNHANKWKIPSSAIGGAGSKSRYGSLGTVTISGGNVYAESALGTAIGGGSSYTVQGGDAVVEITGGIVVAKTLADGSASIGGGTACSSTAGAKYNGGSAKITISGNPVIRTGSIGGGGHGKGSGYIGNATINISGGDIQAQFILAAGTAAEQIPSFTMTGGTIRNSNTEDTAYKNSQQDGGAVYLENGDVNILGGTISHCKAKRGGAIFIKGSTRADGTPGASFTMSGGLIEGNEAVGIDGVDSDGGGGGAVYITNGIVELTGGTINNNLAVGGNGGGIFISQGSLTMNGAEAVISNNTSEIKGQGSSYVGGHGGGVYVHSEEADVDVTLTSGRITGNTADRRGGGLCVIQDSGKKAGIIIGVPGAGDSSPHITGNHCLLQGGGVFASGANAEISIHSGKIRENTVSQYVQNPDVANELGSVTLTGGDVSHIVVTYNANDGSDNPETRTQNIVTKTNSALEAPEFTRLGYSIEKWTTKRSGAGESYTNGAIMNYDKNITLYAQWKRWTQP